MFSTRGFPEKVEIETATLSHYVTYCDINRTFITLQISYDELREFQSNLNVQLVNDCFASLNFSYIPKNGKGETLLFNITNARV